MLLALVLATLNQVFSLLDPLIFRHVIDEYATPLPGVHDRPVLPRRQPAARRRRSASRSSRASRRTSRTTSSTSSRSGSAPQLYSDGIRHSLELPYSVFEDQRSGETLGKLQKVRTDVEKLIAASINVLFTSLVGIVFVMIYAFSVHWIIAPVYFLTVPVLGRPQLGAEPKDQDDPEGDRRRDDGAGRRDDRVAAQHRAGEEPRASRSRRSRGSTPRPTRSCSSSCKKVRYLRSLSFIQGTAVNFLRTSILFLMLYLIYTRAITVGQFFSLFIYSFFIFGPLQELGNIINIYRETEVVARRTSRTSSTMPSEPRPAQPGARSATCATLAFEHVSFKHQSASSPAARGHLVRRSAAARRSRSSGPSGAGQDDARQAAGRPLSAAARAASSTTACRRPQSTSTSCASDRLRHAGHAALLGHDPREPAVRATRRDRRGVPRRAATRRRATACSRAPTAASTR